MIRILGLIVIVLLAVEANSGAYDDPRVEIYKNDFEHETLRNADSITIELVDNLYSNNPEIIGYCYRTEHLIKIRHDFWINADPLSRKAVVYHELGHCLLSRSHRDDLLSDNCPKSLMNAGLPPVKCLYVHYNEYVQELVTGR